MLQSEYKKKTGRAADLDEDALRVASRRQSGWLEDRGPPPLYDPPPLSKSKQTSQRRRSHRLSSQLSEEEKEDGDKGGEEEKEEGEDEEQEQGDGRMTAMERWKVKSEHSRQSHLELAADVIYHLAQDEAEAMVAVLAQSLRTNIGIAPAAETRVFPKGLGLTCTKEIAANSFIGEYFGEVYPAWRWFEKVHFVCVAVSLTFFVYFMVGREQ